MRFTLVVLVVVFACGNSSTFVLWATFFSLSRLTCDPSAVLFQYRHWLYPFSVTRAVPLWCASHFRTRCADDCRWVARVSCGDRREMTVHASGLSAFDITSPGSSSVPSSDRPAAGVRLGLAFNVANCSAFRLRARSVAEPVIDPRAFRAVEAGRGTAADFVGSTVRPARADPIIWLLTAA